jgi:hypothetical protein
MIVPSSEWTSRRNDRSAAADAKRAKDGFDRWPDRERDATDSRAGAVAARQERQLLEERGQLVGDLDALGTTRGGRLLGPRRAQLGAGSDLGRRRPQLVCDVAVEAPLSLEGRFEASDEVVQALADATELG